MRSSKVLKCVSALVLGLLASARAQIAQIQWDVQQDRPVAHDVYVWQGETVDLLPRLVQGTAPLAVTNAPVEFRYREASLPTNTYRYVAAAANTNSGVLSVRWIPDYDAGAAWYDYQIIVGSNAANPRAFGRITMRPTIGWNASTNPPPPITLYPSRAELQRASNELANALQFAITSTVPAQIAAATGSIGNASSPDLTNQLAVFNSALTNEAALRAMADASLNAAVTNEAAVRSASAASILATVSTNRVTRWYSSETNWLEWSGNELREFVITRAPMEDPQVISITFSSDFDSVWGDFPYAGQTLIVPKYYADQIEATPGSGFYWSFLFDATNHYGYVAESAPVGVFNIWESDSPSETPYTVGPRDDPFGGGIGTGSAVVSNVYVYGVVTNLMSTRYMLDSQTEIKVEKIRWTSPATNAVYVQSWDVTNGTFKVLEVIP